MLLSCRFQVQPQSNTTEPANQGVQGYLIITGRCVGAGLELKSAERYLSRSRVGDPCVKHCLDHDNYDSTATIHISYAASTTYGAKETNKQQNFRCTRQEEEQKKALKLKWTLWFLWKCVLSLK